MMILFGTTMNNNPASPTPGPISFRPNAQDRAVIEQVEQSEGLSTSEILRRGLELVRQQEIRNATARRMPYYALEVDDPKITEAIEGAADAACAVLDELMRGLGSKFPERDGIDSNFRGLLGEHVKAMLSGHEHAKKSYSTAIKPLFAHYFSFGTTPAAAAQQGYTLTRMTERVGGDTLYFSEGQWVSLQDIDIGGLYTSREAAITEVLARMHRVGESVRENPMQLVVIDFSSGILQQVA